MPENALGLSEPRWPFRFGETVAFGDYNGRNSIYIVIADFTNQIRMSPF